MGEVAFDLVLEMFQGFGPQRLIPIEVRWREAFPEATDAEMAEWKARCRHIEAEAYAIAERFLAGEMTETAARELFRARFPDLTRDRAQRTMGQAFYFASK